MITMVDMTEHRSFADALQVSDERMRLLVESARDYAIFTIDPQRRVDTWNAGAEAVLGYIEAEILGSSADVIFTPEDQAADIPRKEVETAATKGRAADERWHMRKDGKRFYGSGMVRPLRNPNGSLMGFVKIMRDLTEPSSRCGRRSHTNDTTPA